MSKQEVIICHNLEENLNKAINQCPHDKLFVLADEHTRELCIPVVSEFDCIKNAHFIYIGAEDVHKNLETLAYVWKELGDKGASRHSLLINLGGGMVTDLGGFAASTFKRGIKYINIPSPAESVLIDANFLKSLDIRNLLSGYAEMLKHGLISTHDHWIELLKFDFNNIDYKVLQTLVGKSVQIKEDIVEQDPFERGIRKALNLGHTVGHAFESLALETQHPILHGYAVAWGIVCELYFSHIKTGFPKDKLRQTILFVKEHYGVMPFNCKQYERLYEFMKHDKKNSAGIINFTLLTEIGNIQINQSASKDEIFEMLDFYHESMGC